MDQRMFAWEDVAAEAGITPEQLAEIERTVRLDYPRDEMLYELHVLRACMAVRDGFCTAEEAMREPE